MSLYKGAGKLISVPIISEEKRTKVSFTIRPFKREGTPNSSELKEEPVILFFKCLGRKLVNGNALFELKIV